MEPESENQSEIKKRTRFVPDSLSLEYSDHFVSMELGKQKKTLNYFDSLYRKAYKLSEHKKLAERLKKM